MKTLVRLALFGAGFLIALLAVQSCMAPVAPFVATCNPTAIHPPGTVTITATGRTGGTYFYQPTGQDVTPSTQNTFVATVDRWPWSVTVTWRDGDNVATATARLILANERPVAHDLWVWPEGLSTGSLARFDLRYLQHGCDNGTAESYSGFKDPDYNANGYSMENDSFSYHIDVYDAAGNHETVYKPDRTVLGADEFTASPYFVWFVGWKAAIPPFPFAPQSVTDLDCDPTPPPPDPPPTQTESKRVEVTVKEWGNQYRFVYIVTTAVTGCGI